MILAKIKTAKRTTTKLFKTRIVIGLIVCLLAIAPIANVFAVTVSVCMQANTATSMMDHGNLKMSNMDVSGNQDCCDVSSKADCNSSCNELASSFIAIALDPATTVVVEMDTHITVLEGYLPSLNPAPLLRPPVFI